VILDRDLADRSSSWLPYRYSDQHDAGEPTIHASLKR
jgi:hypothetical protein